MSPWESIDLSRRAELVEKLTIRYPEHIPVYCISTSEKYKLKDSKFLCPKKMRFSEFQAMIRRKIGTGLHKSHALYFLINNVLVSSNSSLIELYNNYKEEDGILYIKFNEESTFG